MTYQEAMDKAAKDYLTEVLQSVNGNMEKAARIAQYDRAHFYVLVRRHNINYRDLRPRPNLVVRPSRVTSCSTPI